MMTRARPIYATNAQLADLRDELIKQLDMRFRSQSHVTHGQLARHDFVEREQLADLRDELEEMMESYLTQASSAQKYYKRAEAVYDRVHKELEQMRLVIRDIEAVLGLDPHCPRYTTALQKPITWSYFHVWIARINERLDKIEKERG